MNISKPNEDELPSIRQLVIASIAALLLLAALVVTVILPAEKGIDISGVGSRLHLTRMGQIKSAMDEEDAPEVGRPLRNDEVSFTLPAGQGMEIKLEMKKGFVVDFSWNASGGLVEHDTHGDPHVNRDIYVSYSKADAVDGDTGSIKAVYSGLHGWYWKNNGRENIKITLKTSGEYIELVPM